MKWWSSLGAVTIILALGGCNEKPQASIEYDPTARFAGLKTYRWLEDSRRVTADRELPEAEVCQRVVLAVDKALKEKGYVLAADGKTDFFVGYHVGLKGRPDVRSMNAYYNYIPGWAWDHYRYGRELDPKDPEQPTMVLEDYGSVAVDVAIPSGADVRLIWRGTMRAVVPKEREKKVDQEWFDKGAREVFEKFPPNS